MKNENDLIFNSYAQSSGVVRLTEAEQVAVAEQQTKQKFQQQLQHPKTQQAMLKQAEELKTKYQKDIDQALQKDGGKAGPAVEALLKKIEAALNAQAQQQVKESLDLQEEGIFKQMGSLASGALKRAGDVMNNRPSDKGFRQEAILKRFESLKKSVGSHLRELQRDMETTSNVDTKVKEAVNKQIATIESKGFAPTSSKFQDIRHSVGKFAQNVVTGAILAVPIVALAAPFAAALGLGGAAAAAVTAGISGGSVSVLKDLITGQKPNGKRAVITALAAAATAGLFKMAVDHFSSSGVAGQTTPAQSNSPTSVADVSDAPVADYAQSPTELGQEMSGSSGLTAGVTSDDVLTNSMEVMRQQGVLGVNKAGQAIPSPVVYNYIAKIAKADPEHAQRIVDYIKNMPKGDALDKLSWAARKSGNALELLKTIK